MPAHVLVHIAFGGQLSGVRSLLPLCGFRDQTLASSPALPVFTVLILRTQAQHTLSSLSGLLSLLLGDRQYSNLTSHTHTQMKSLSGKERMLNMLRWHKRAEVEQTTHNKILHCSFANSKVIKLTLKKNK